MRKVASLRFVPREQIQGKRQTKVVNLPGGTAQRLTGLSVSFITNRAAILIYPVSMSAYVTFPWRIVCDEFSTAAAFLIAALCLVSCGNGTTDADMSRGRQLFAALPCSGCHGAVAQGGFGPALAGTVLSFEEVQRQVRRPRDQMPAFDQAEVSEQELRDIHAWLRSLPASTPTSSITLPAPEATAAARDQFYAAFDASDVLAQIDELDEAALRIRGTVTAIEEQERFTEVSVLMTEDQTVVTVRALYDTWLSRQSFPAEVGNRVTLYGIGAEPVQEEQADGTLQKLPLIQVLDVVVHE